MGEESSQISLTRVSQKKCGNGFDCYHRRDALVKEIALRGYRHGSRLPKRLAGGSAVPRVLVDRRNAQIEILASAVAVMCREL